MYKMTFIIIVYNALNLNLLGHVIKDGYQHVDV